MLSGWRICVTGGAGFIGTHLIERLAPHNRLVVFDNFHRDALTRSGLDKNPNVEIVRGDVMDAAAVMAVTKGCAAGGHMAAVAGGATRLKNPALTMKAHTP